MRWKWIRPLTGIAAISYPLYLVHIPLAWISLAWFARHGWSMLPASIATAAVILATAWAVHVLVEEPGRKLGKALSSKTDAAKMFKAATGS